MTVSEIMTKMVSYSNGNLHDINHFLKVYAYAKTIGECEHLPAFEQKCLEVSAIVHDIACPLCREKYGTTAGPYQEREGMILTREFLADCGLSAEVVERVVYLVGHHHTLSAVDGPDYQILLEADYLVNADEGRRSTENIESTLSTMFKTATGTALLKAIYL